MLINDESAFIHHEASTIKDFGENSDLYIHCRIFKITFKAMLFNTYEFIFLFLPVVLCGFFGIARRNHRLAALWLAAASLFFYGWWNPRYVLLLLSSITFNYTMGYIIGHARIEARYPNKAGTMLVIGVAANLVLLAYYKYTNFFIVNANQLTGTRWALEDIILPLGISFFTFTQIAFLVDVRRGIAREYSFIHYLLFVTYFPHLIAGPVLHHKQMMPQFGHSLTYKFCIDNFNIGLVIFTIGLCKKVILADQFALYADPVFASVTGGGDPKLIEAWVGALAYTLQIYFDFSAYSDMAIGLSKMLNVDIPINFNSPYKAANIIEFWRRWHMTLSQFLRDYLYIPLGGSRKGNGHRFANLMITMLLGGLWHGANWTFVIWGGLHGAYLIINHAWRALCYQFQQPVATPCWHVIGVVFTFLAVVIAWVFFRVDNIETATRMLSGMMGLNGVSMPPNLVAMLGTFGAHLTSAGFFELTAIQIAEHKPMMWIPIGLAIIWLFPNTMELATMIKTRGNNSLFAGGLTGMVFVYAIMNFSKLSPFIYFQF